MDIGWRCQRLDEFVEETITTQRSNAAAPAFHTWDSAPLPFTSERQREVLEMPARRLEPAPAVA
jgi:hypothetical protein